ncbi:MAG: class II aldolase [Alphaproteobacteria bacterium]|nr:class II aldolase [Hyphomonas sp.]MBR9807091.1 class II aldolase [Alphaproteobacteria bacterium]
MTEQDAREALVAAMVQMDAGGLNHGTAGNVSLRLGDGFLVSPSGIPAQDLTPDSIVLMRFDGQYDGPVKPSSEWRMHAGILAARQDVNAVVHCHSRFATTLACAHKPIPFLHYMVAMSGGSEIPVAPYATFGTQALADNIVTSLKGRNACLMANHGQIAVAKGLRQALAIAGEVETQAGYYYGTLAIGGPQVLGGDSFDQVVARFQGYGQV